jgi:SAM-dependent methyltransferase
MLRPLKAQPLTLVLQDLGLKPERVRTIGDEPMLMHSDGQHALCCVPAQEHAAAAAKNELLSFVRSQLSENGACLLFLEGARTEAELAQWREALWPLVHLGAIYELSTRGIQRRTLGKREALKGATGLAGTLLVGRRVTHVLSPQATREKFDSNAAGWNLQPGKPGWKHYRWMRRFVGHFTPAQRFERVLDFGCGAGWVGIEAALRAGTQTLDFFDPSPEMVRHAEQNARACGLQSARGRVGYGEAPPFPGEGERPYPLVVCSGVLSFSPDPQAFFDGLLRALEPGGTLVIGDIQRDSRGMRRRRETKALLPVRELNAWTHTQTRAELERRGLRFEAACAYQYSRPLPQLMHFNEVKLGGALDGLFVSLNALASRCCGQSYESFDSWVLRLRRPS